MRSSTSIYESLGSQFFKTTTVIQSGPVAFAGKTGREIPKSSRLRFLVKFSANNFALSDAEDNTPRDR